MVAELLDRVLDAQFDIDFDEAGLFRKRKIKGREYWHFKPSERGTAAIPDLYVGPTDDEAITRRVTNFSALKSDYQGRRKIVSTLIREARLFSPEQRVGEVIEAFWKAGLFRLRACLVGTIAYQTYGTVLGYRLTGTAMQIGDIDLAQFHSISVAVEDSIPPVLDVLQSVDQSFHPALGLDDHLGASKFEARNGLRVEFLTPNRGSDEYTGKPVKMPSLGGAVAEPLRFLDFLIHEPVRAVLLYKGGIPVFVPEPARYAVHKLIVSSRRKPGTGKDLKDLEQAEQLVEALGETGRHDDLLAAFEEARERGSARREAIEKSLTRMKALGMTKIATALTGNEKYPTRTVRVGYFALPTTSMGVRVLANCAMVMTAASVGNSLLVPSVALMIISRVAAFGVVLDFMQMTDTSPKFAQSLAQDLPRRR